MLKKTAYLFIAVMFVAAVQTASACGEAKAETIGKATFEGTLVCQGCDLKKSEGARAECSAFGHKHALKTKDGRLVNFLENQYSADLIKGGDYHMKNLAVSGTYYPGANMLDLESFTMGDKKQSWCEGHKEMDGCMAAGHKH